MARIPPRPAPPSQDWLLRATRKLEKSIFRTVEHKYRNIILGLKAHIKELKEFKENALDDVCRLESDLSAEQRKVEDLEDRLSIYEEPSVVANDASGEKDATGENNTSGENFWVDQYEERIEKRKRDEIEVVNALEELSSKVLKIGSPPRVILAPPILPPSRSPRTLGKKRERSSSSSSKSSPRHTRIRKNIAQEGNTPVTQTTNSEPSTLSTPMPSVNKKKRKRKKEKEKE